MVKVSIKSDKLVETEYVEPTKEIIPSKTGFILQEVPIPVSPSSNKRRAKDVAKHISKKMKKTTLILQDDSMKEEEVPETPKGDVSSKKKSHVKLTFEEIGISSSSVKTSTVDTTTILVDSTKILTSKLILVIPPEVSISKSFLEELRTLDISTHVSDMDVNVNMGEGVSEKEHPVSTQCILEISIITTNTSLPPFITTVSTTTHSPTFDQVINQPITSLFPYQSIDPPKLVHDDDTDDGGFRGSFVDLEFDPEEEDTLDHMLMLGKQYKILNRKLNSLLPSQADSSSIHSVSGIDVDVMLKA
ncbi:unnamed protein product [Lactuca saligna]|uniref:Uncharacterized protein n=1 Tax=Lactuca saligna TaxID=75948 RepID=A0AA36A1Z0_LACSI|nr:unnamed protein product [Lactuca saligna]